MSHPQEDHRQISQNSGSNSVLQIPELLHSVLLEVREEFWYANDQTILSCTLVNSLWNYEANRLLWEFVGEALGNNRHPLVRHLVAIEKTRRQGLARHIRTLYLRNAPSKSEAPLDEWEGRFHTELSSLSFPALEEFFIGSPGRQDPKDYPSIKTPLPYAQSRLRIFEIFDFSGTSGVTFGDEFLQTLSIHSRNLTQVLLIMPSVPCIVTKRGFSKFFSDAQNLTRLVLELQAPALSPEAFSNLSRIPNLTHLSISYVNADWVQDLESGAFPSLLSLECGIDSRGLTRLLEITSNIEALEVKAVSGSTDLPRRVGQAMLTQLKELSIIPAVDTNMSVQDLRSIAGMAPKLEKLCIPAAYYDDMDDDLNIPGMNDEDLKGLAQLLPTLKVLTLVFDNSQLTERCLISLGRGCPMLQGCTISAKVHYEKLAQEAISRTFANLEKLTIVDTDVDDEEDTDEDELASTEHNTQLARRLIQLMPKLRDPDFPDKSDLSLAMKRILRSEG